MRRDPAAIITAHMMDPSRKEVYVEGISDRIFLRWVCGDRRCRNAEIVDIDAVSLPGAEAGGARARLLNFVQMVSGSGARILCFADADTDRLLQRAVPDNVVLTDGRDSEGYVLNVECLEKVLRLGLRTEAIEESVLLVEVLAAAAELGAIRLASDLDGLNLPFQRTRLERHVSVAGSKVAVDLTGYIRALLQNAGISLTRLDHVRERAVAVARLHAGSPELVHGKDAFRLVDVALRSFGVDGDEARRLLWCSYERARLASAPALSRVVDFLTTE